MSRMGLLVGVALCWLMMPLACFAETPRNPEKSTAELVELISTAIHDCVISAPPKSRWENTGEQQVVVLDFQKVIERHPSWKLTNGDGLLRIEGGGHFVEVDLHWLGRNCRSKQLSASKVELTFDCSNYLFVPGAYYYTMRIDDRVVWYAFLFDALDPGRYIVPRGPIEGRTPEEDKKALERYVVVCAAG